MFRVAHVLDQRNQRSPHHVTARSPEISR
jgi:hypothetical protein